eukprot:666558-Prorocentrum_minimum.AAC.1
MGHLLAPSKLLALELDLNALLDDDPVEVELGPVEVHLRHVDLVLHAVRLAVKVQLALHQSPVPPLGLSTGVNE